MSEAVQWNVVVQASRVLADKIGSGRSPRHTRVFGIPRGGSCPAVLVAERLGLPMTDTPAQHDTIVVDDLWDSGRTMRPYVEAGYLCGALFAKHEAHEAVHIGAYGAPDRWLVFPWEGNETGPEDAVVRLLEYIGEDPGREGLLDTPKRVVKAMAEMTAGSKLDPAMILSTTFSDVTDEMIVVSPIEFASTCEHHLLPFTGRATVGYIPGNRVVGLSKIPRLVDCFAHRLQIQERLTSQIAGALNDNLAPRGVGVIITATHSCMVCRGVRKPGTMMTTSSLLGFMKDDPKARAEFLSYR